MPRYDYDCAACGRRFEVMHGVHADPPAACPLCGGGPVKKAITAANVHYKGSGWAKKERRTAVGSGSSSAGGDEGSTAAASDENASGTGEGAAAKAGDRAKAGDGAKSGDAASTPAKSPKPDTSSKTPARTAD